MSGTHPRTWLPSASILAAYFQEFGVLPRQSGATSDRERAAGNILRSLRRRARAAADVPLQPEQRAWLDKNVPAWLSDNTRPAAGGCLRGVRQFESRVMAASRFLTKTGRLPSASSSSPAEAVLGKFLDNHRQAAQGKGTTAWSKSKQLRLNRLVPGWYAPSLSQNSRNVAFVAS